MPSDAMRVWRDELAYAVKLADWAAGQGFVQIDDLEDPEEWCFRMWQELGPPNGDGYTANALAAAVIERAIADAVEQERAKAEALAEALRWYAERVAGCYESDFKGNISRRALEKDRGNRATAALKAWEKGDT